MAGQRIGQSPPADDFVPFEGADVVRPEEIQSDEGQSNRTGDASVGVGVDQFIIKQFGHYRARVPASVWMAAPQILWFEEQAGGREGVAVVLLVRKDVYGQPRTIALSGPARQLLVDLMAGVGGHVTNLHRIPEGAVTRVGTKTGSLAQAVYMVLERVDQGGRIQNAVRWVIGSFRESDSPIEAFRPMFGALWEACDSLRASEPVLIIGRHVLAEDDLRLRRLYRRAGRELDWPAYAGSAPDPGLRCSPVPDER